MKTIDELGISPWPWSVDEGFAIERFGDFLNQRDKGLHIEDAIFIAAAPEMYSALREVYEEYSNCIPYEVIEKIKNALAKASGEEMNNG